MVYEAVQADYRSQLCLLLQEAYGKLQEWTVSSEAAARKLATRAGALQEAMEVRMVLKSDAHAH